MARSVAQRIRFGWPNFNLSIRENFEDAERSETLALTGMSDEFISQRISAKCTDDIKCFSFRAIEYQGVAR